MDDKRETVVFVISHASSTVLWCF